MKSMPYVLALALDKWANAVPVISKDEGWNKRTGFVMEVTFQKYQNATCFTDHNGLTHEFREVELLSFHRSYL